LYFNFNLALVFQAKSRQIGSVSPFPDISGEE
jgi:hypothetical protein